MQMNINLDSIFGSANDDSYIGTEYQSYQPSELDSSKSQKNHSKLNVPIFDEDDSERSSVITPIKTKTPSVLSFQTSLSSFNGKTPGERLYYQSKAELARKKLQMERMKLEQLKQQEQKMTFKPKINKNSEKIVETKAKISKPAKKQLNNAIPSHIKKQQEQIMQCTFKPQKISKSSTMLPRNKTKDQVFEQLFYAHKFKKVKQKMTEQQKMQIDNLKQKKLTKAELQGFLQRSNNFLNKVEKKKQLILTTSTKYDLKTGKKLFSPSINTNPFKEQQGIFFTQRVKTPKAKPTYEQQKDSWSSSETREVGKNSIFKKNNNKNQQEQEYVLPYFQTKNNRKIFTKHQGHEGEQNSYDQEQYEEGSKIFNIMEQNQQKLDQDHQVTDEAPYFQTVNEFQFPSERQMKKKSFDDDQNQYQQQSSNNLDGSYSKQFSKEEKFEGTQPFETTELPVKSKQQKQEQKSEYAETQYEGYEGEDSRFKSSN